MNIASHKKTILILIVILLVFFGYWFFFLSKKDAQVQTGNVNVVAQAPATSNTQYDKEFVTSLLGLNSVDLDVKIFQSKAYIALSYPEVPFVVNYSRESGRNNPFLPIGLESGTAAKPVSQTKESVVATTTAATTTPTAATSTPAVKPTPKKF